ncbi:hypothetical protein NKR74_20770 [Bacillus sp. 3103sda1]|uniref:hypothetical protein n=1 Tax=Bacillus sp. 3103sda1 TaxID=2953808 RepID=UPI0020A08CEC|nr:hypothetical protein [Bacillus sp. 3103sda1]MCP1125728.1 hypothetical protein [Bacillus sp. 3103sda1]
METNKRGIIMSEKKKIELEKEIDDLKETEDIEEIDEDDDSDIIILDSKDGSRVYYVDPDDYEEEELKDLDTIRDRLDELFAEKKKKKKKAWTITGIIVALFIGISMLEGYQNDKLIENGFVYEAPIIDKAIKKKNFFSVHPTLYLYVDGRLESVWVSQDVYDKARKDDKIHIVEVEKGKGEIRTDPRYEDDELIIEREPE